MPRVKKIDMGEQKMEDIRNRLIEVRDCSAAELVFLQPLTKEERNIIKSAFPYVVTERGIRIPKFKNSWKGLVLFLLALTHIRYGEKVTAWVTDRSMSGSWLLATENYNYAFECKDNFGKVVEVLPKVSGYNRCYICGKWKPETIERSLRGFAEILGIDEKSSIINIAPAKSLPHVYSSRIVDFPPLQLKSRMPKGIEELWYSKEYKKKLDEDYEKFQKKEHETKLLEYLEKTNM